MRREADSQLRRKSLLSTSAVVSAAFLFGVIVALATTLLIALLFGLNRDADAYFVAILLPRFVMTIFNGTLPQVLIPAVSGTRTGESDARHRALINNLLSLGTLVGLPIYLLLLVFSRRIVTLMAPGFDDQTLDLCSDLFRYASIGVPLSFHTEALGAFLNSRGVYARPSGAEAVRSALVVAALLLFHKQWGIRAAAYGFFAGYLLQLLFLAVVAHRAGHRFRFHVHLRDEDFRRVVRSLALPAIGAGTNFLPGMVQRFLASFLPVGAVSAFAMAQQAVGVLFTLTLRSVNVAAHPMVSKHAADGDTVAMNATLVQSLKLSVLAGSALYFFVASLSRDGLNIVAGVGSFTNEDAVLLTSILATLGLVLPLSGTVQVLRSPHFALGNSRLPAIHMVATGLVHIALQFALFKPLGVIGIALAQVLWVLVSIVTIFPLLPAPCKPVGPRSLGVILKTSIIAVTLGLVAFSVRAWLVPPAPAMPYGLRVVFAAGLGVASCATLWFLYRAAFVTDYADVLGDLRLRTIGAKIGNALGRARHA